ncbi:MAG: TVP38/TMEM64 family protein [Pseudomonadota bacterium]
MAALVAVLLLARSLPLAEWLTEAETWVAENPLLGGLAYVSLAALSGVLMTPGWVPMALAGLLFGFLPGIAWGTAGVACGATAAMLVGRAIARPWVAARIADNPKLSALDEALGERAFLIVFLTRVAMVLPYNLINYAYGLTRVGLPTYLGATMLGMLPIVVLYAYLGSIAADIGAVLSGEAKPAGGWWIVVVGVVAITLVIVIVRRTVNGVLDQRMVSPQEAAETEGDR